MKSNLALRLLVGALIVIISATAAFQMTKKGSLSQADSVVASSSVPAGASGSQTVEEIPVTGLSWDIKESEKDDMPESDVRMVATYADGSTKTTSVSKVVGSCNPEDVETKLALNSEQLTCYYAGLGHKFRIIDSAEGYLVQMKVFEEASPDYNPPVEEFKTLVTVEKQYRGASFR